MKDVLPLSNIQAFAIIICVTASTAIGTKPSGFVTVTNQHCCGVGTRIKFSAMVIQILKPVLLAGSLSDLPCGSTTLLNNREVYERVFCKIGRLSINCVSVD
jgi:hypothetical protein